MNSYSLPKVTKLFMKKISAENMTNGTCYRKLKLIFKVISVSGFHVSVQNVQSETKQLNTKGWRAKRALSKSPIV